MRPKEAWDKSQKGPDEKRKRGSSSRRPRNGSMSGMNAGKGAAGNSTTYSEPSSPTGTGGQTEKMEADIPTAPQKRPRASSEERTPRKAGRSVMDEASAAAALERAIKSSPHKFIGTQQVPIEVGDLTPQPTRRILFPSPTNSKDGKAKAGNNAESKLSPTPISKTNGVPPPGKENFPPITDSHDELDDFLLKEPGLTAPPTRSTTPTPIKTNKLVYKTPKRSPRRNPPPTTGDFFSSAAKALFRHSADISPGKRTPTRPGSSGPLEHMSPFTAHMNQLLSESNDHHHQSHQAMSRTGGVGARTGDDNDDNANAPPITTTSPANSAQTFDFPSLPSLHNTPGGGVGRSSSRLLDFDFSAFDNQDLISTDVIMPSSPPVWFGAGGGIGFGGDDGDDGEGGKGLWGMDVDVDVEGDVEGEVD